jgi:HlyD family secretion protein
LHFRTLRALAVLLLLPLAGCFEFGGPKKEENKPETAPPPTLIRPGSPVRRAMDRRLEISGEVTALSRTEITSRLSGLAVVELHADMGDAVEKDATLCILDRTEAERELADARLAEREATVKIRDAEAAHAELEAQARGHESVIAQSQKAYDRCKAQAEKGAVAAETLENCQYKLDQDRSMKERIALQIKKAEVAIELSKQAAEKTKSAREKADQNLAWTVVRAPFKGVVSSRTAKLGQIVQSGSPLFELFDPTSLVATSQVTQRALPFVKKGQSVEIRSEAYPEETFIGHVDVVSPVVDAAAGTVPLRISVPDHGRLKPGLFISGRIVIERRENALVVPKKAVLYDRERPYVFRLDAGSKEGEFKVRRLFFHEGLADRDEVEALFDADAEALKPEDRIVLVGQDRLRDGDAVTLEVAAASRPTSGPASRPSNG